jgi:hypothetical protein
MSPSVPFPIDQASMPPITEPFPEFYPPSTSPKITSLWFRYDQEMVESGLPSVNEPRYGPALANMYAGTWGGAYSYEGEYDWCQGNITATTPSFSGNYSGIPGGTRATNMHNMYLRNGFRFFTETAYQDVAQANVLTASDLPPGQGMVDGQPYTGMIRVTAPRDRPLPVNITYSGDWKVGGQRHPALGGWTDFTERRLLVMSWNALYRSKFQPSGTTLDWNSATHAAIWMTRGPDYHSFFWFGERGPLAGTSIDSGNQPGHYLSLNVWDTVDPGETVYYWLARWVSSNKMWLEQTTTPGRPMNGIADGYGNAGWHPPFSWQFDPSIPAGSVTTANTSSYTFPSYVGQGLFMNDVTVDNPPYEAELWNLNHRSHCFQVVTF